ncbi:MAG: hypothetical protein ABIP94_25410 [Planctomycetota bacterium]
MLHRSVTVFFAIASSMSGLAAQATIVSGGSAALQNAINAAVAGDELDVQPGSYTPVTCTKGIRITLQPGAEVGAPLR